ncbi:MAG TPA: hypothetical protein VNO84_07940 [Burkholderiaceae bacterium]|nr:hypothetical protein [Burkholderiaceae bacterium]
MSSSRFLDWRTLVGVTALSAVLAGCGGGGSDSDSSGPGNPPPTASATGVFTDAPVNGLNYTASPSGASGVTGDTGTAGGFRYEPGDTVTFTLGGLQLGQAQGAPSVSPADIAGRDANKAMNLMVLLQSLDSDADEGVIKISLPAGTSLSNVPLTAEPATFAAAPALTTAIAAAGGTPVTPEAAMAHARAQFWKSIAGVWVIEVADGGSVIIRFDDQGRYLLGETGVRDDAGGPGVEHGSITWDPATLEATAVVTEETNGEWGLSHPQGGKFLLRYDGERLYVRDIASAADDWTTFRRGRNSATQLPGFWALLDPGQETAPFVVQTFAFGGNGSYLMIDPIGDVAEGEGDESCGGPGVESGSYSLEGGTLKLTTIHVDTNGCAGLNEPLSPTVNVPTELRSVQISADGNTLTAEVWFIWPDREPEFDDTVTLQRIRF